MSGHVIEVNGVTLGDGTEYRISDLDGFESRVVKTSDEPNALGHGDSPGRDFLESRTLIIEVNFGDGRTESNEQIWSMLQQLKAAWATGDDTQLVWRPPGTDEGYIHRGRCRNFDFNLERSALGYVTGTLEFYCPNPLRLSEEEQILNWNRAAQEGGLSWPHGYPHGWGARSGGTAVIVNEGNIDAESVIRVYGPVTDPRIYHVEQERVLFLEYEVPAGRYVEFDTAARTVTADGAAYIDGNLTLTSRWFNLSPGPNTLKYQSDDVPSVVTGPAEIHWRSAWE